MKKVFTLIVVCMTAISTWAYDVEVGGIYYNLNTTEKTADVTYKTTSYNSYSGSVTIPESIVSDGVTYSVTSIGKYAFRNCSGLTSVTINNSVTSIVDGAFWNCHDMTSVIISNSVTRIGDDAFRYCSGLTSVTIPNSVTGIGSGAFYGCTGLNSMTIPNSVTSIGSSAFDGCSSLTSVTIGNSVTSIGGYAFADCSGLTSVTIGNSVTKIESFAFKNCSSLTKVNISDLASWVKITFVNGPMANPLYYAHHLYLNDEEVKDLVIPNSVTSIGNFAFHSCTGLTSVTIPNSVTIIGGESFSKCTGLTSVTIPNSVTSIGRGSFSYCSGLTSVDIPNSVTNIVDYAFVYCSGIKTVSIGTGITSIGQQAFASCNNIETVTCYAEEVPTSGTDMFSDSPVSSATLKVPNASVELYKAADQWKEFGTIVGVTKCATPTISLKDGKVVATSETEGATCNVSYQINGSNGTYTLDVTAYATADNYAQSETVTATYPLNVGVYGDYNGDGTVNVADVNSLVNKLLGK